MKKTLRYITGLTFIVLGIIGCFLPVLQGILFLIIGIIILSSEVPAAQKLLSILEKKYPGIFKKAKDFMKGNTDKNTTNGK
ncbi:MAG: PGPGW domain-containing protein [Syntrophales bacterium]|nr:PGPGW domain-containing protein [Syntrophales bacterium]